MDSAIGLGDLTKVEIKRKMSSINCFFVYPIIGKSVASESNVG